MRRPWLLLAVCLAMLCSCAGPKSIAEPPESAPAPASAPAAPTHAPSPSPEPSPAPEPPETPLPEETDPEDPESEEEWVYDFEKDEGLYYIKVNVEANTVTVYARDENGQYTVPYMAMVCSTGEDTPRDGIFRPGYHLRWQELFGDVYGQFITQIHEDILFHSVPYLRNRDPGSLEYWEFDKLGTACSQGCVRLQVIDAKWIYDHFWAVGGIEFYVSEDPGPLGKPEAPKIGDNLQARGWDPTDPDGANPWRELLTDGETD